ncbi:MAG: hypothetical protein QOE86_4335 [Solirubrobacteraceae bacterium]|jgi:CheY-like chemotaxis protein|nr:hypothetical protein [Solirubrobacteraceae bacterium]
MLRRAGFAVREVSNGAEAVEAAQERPPDIAVLDVRMPVVDGFEACRRMKEQPATANVPVLMLSATFLETEAQVEGLETGADAYLTQPVEAPVLAATIRALLRARRAESEVHVAARQWRTTFDAIRDAVAVVDEQGAIVRGNRAFAALAQRAPRELGGTAVSELWPALDLEARANTDLMLGDRTFSVRVDRVPPEAVGDGLGQAVLTLADVTVERQAQETRAQALLRERTISRTLQQSLLPERLPTYRHLRTSAWHRAAERDLMIGGDWYDVIDTEAGTWLVIGDVAGHGVAAAAQAGQLRHSLRVYAHEGFELAEVLQRLNELVMTTELTEFATLCIARLDVEAEHVSVVRAGHPPPLLIPHGGKPELFEESRGPVLGIDAGPFAVVETDLHPGDRLVLYTDGLIERPGESLDLGFERLLDAAAGLGDLDQLRAGLLERLVDVAALRDDVALLLAERR